MNAIIPGTTAVGFSMLVAAFTQKGDITHYHLFICIALANTVSGSAPYGLVGFFLSDRRQRLTALYFFIYQLTYVASISQAIQKLMVWKDEPGKCFNTGIGSVYGLHGLFERDNLVLWFQVNLAYTLFRQVVVPIVFWKRWPSVWAPKTRRARCTLSFVFIQAPRLLSFVWSIYWVHIVTTENHHLIEGDENTWGFGQVSTFVAFLGSLYGTIIAFRSKCVHPDQIGCSSSECRCSSGVETRRASPHTTRPDFGWGCTSKYFGLLRGDDWFPLFYPRITGLGMDSCELRWTYIVYVEVISCLCA